MKQEFRYERKFVIPATASKDIELMLKLHPAMLREIYHQRFVNNIYLDSVGLKNFFDNVDGLLERSKFRIRWYGDLLGQISSPVLECKYKRGVVGTKYAYPLNDFSMYDQFNVTTLRKVYMESSLPHEILSTVLDLRLTLLNRYSRKYFLSDDQQCRITVDSHFEYYEIRHLTNSFCQKHKNYKDVIVELKYNKAHDTSATSISNVFPFSLSKFSKYVNGIQMVLNTNF